MHYYTRSWKRMALCAVAALLLLASMQGAVWANGAAFHPAPATGIPYPVEQPDLILDREEVIFRYDNVDAQFWIRNPTDTDITVYMGFPLGLRKPGSQPYPGHNLKILRTTTQLTVEGTAVPFTVEYHAEGDYSEIYQWKMTFPAGKTTHYRLRYPLQHTVTMSDGIGDDTLFEYVTHTGAFWAKPIGRARFLYCNPVLENLPAMKQESDGSLGWHYWDEFDQYMHETLEIRPRPFSFDKEMRCIEWTRTNWTPQKDVDDLQVKWSDHHAMKILSSEYEYMPCCSPSVASTLEILCQHGSEIGIPKNEVVLTEDGIAALHNQTYEYMASHGLGVPKYFYSYKDMPRHHDAEFDVHIYRYLRNRIMARRGHTFQDIQLRECFKGIEQSDAWTEVDKKNMVFIKKREKQAKARYRRELDKAGIVLRKDRVDRFELLKKQLQHPETRAKAQHSLLSEYEGQGFTEVIGEIALSQRETLDTGLKNRIQFLIERDLTANSVSSLKDNPRAFAFLAPTLFDLMQKVISPRMIKPIGLAVVRLKPENKGYLRHVLAEYQRLGLQEHIPTLLQGETDHGTIGLKDLLEPAADVNAHFRVREQAIAALGSYRSQAKEFTHILRGVARERSDRLAEEARKSLYRLGGIEELTDILVHDAREDRILSTIKYLGLMGTRAVSAVPALQKRLLKEYRNIELFRPLIAALVHIQPELQVKWIIKNLADKKTAVSLSFYPVNDIAYPHLKNLQSHPDPKIRDVVQKTCR